MNISHRKQKRNTTLYFDTLKELHDWNNSHGERRCRSQRVDTRKHGYYLRPCHDDNPQCFGCHAHSDDILRHFERLMFRAIGNLDLNGVELYHVTVSVMIGTDDWIYDAGRLSSLWAKIMRKWRYRLDRDDKHHVWCKIASQGDNGDNPHYHIISTEPLPDAIVPDAIDLKCQHIGNTQTDRARVSRYMKKNLADVAQFTTQRFTASQRDTSFRDWSNPEIWHRHPQNRPDRAAASSVGVYTAGKITKTEKTPLLHECRLCGLKLPHTTDYFYRNGDRVRSECDVCWSYVNAATKANWTAQKYDAIGCVTWQDIRDLVQASSHGRQWRCYWKNELIDTWSVDHIVPLSRGGSNTIDNLCITSPATNSAKADKPLRRWLSELATLGIRHELMPEHMRVQRTMFHDDDMSA